MLKRKKWPLILGILVLAGLYFSVPSWRVKTILQYPYDEWGNSVLTHDEQLDMNAYYYPSEPPGPRRGFCVYDLDLRSGIRSPKWVWPLAGHAWSFFQFGSEPGSVFLVARVPAGDASAYLVSVTLSRNPFGAQTEPVFEIPGLGANSGASIGERGWLSPNCNAVVGYTPPDLRVTLARPSLEGPKTVWSEKPDSVRFNSCNGVTWINETDFVFEWFGSAGMRGGPQAGHVSVVNAVTAATRELVPAFPQSAPISYVYDVSPDCKYVAVCHSSMSDPELLPIVAIHALPDGQPLAEIGPLDRDATGVAWAPDSGRLLILQEGSLKVFSMNAKSIVFSRDIPGVVSSTERGRKILPPAAGISSTRTGSWSGRGGSRKLLWLGEDMALRCSGGGLILSVLDIFDATSSFRTLDGERFIGIGRAEAPDHVLLSRTFNADHPPKFLQKSAGESK